MRFQNAVHGLALSATREPALAEDVSQEVCVRAWRATSQEIQTKARADRTPAEWRRRYAICAGCEATVSESVHAHGPRNCRYRGMARSHVQHVLTAAGTNIIRLSEYLSPGITPPRSPRPRNRFQTLCRSLPT
ncbi:transposase [Streptomyces sp. NPDC055400]